MQVHIQQCTLIFVERLSNDDTLNIILLTIDFNLNKIITKKIKQYISNKN